MAATPACEVRWHTRRKARAASGQKPAEQPRPAATLTQIKIECGGSIRNAEIERRALADLGAGPDACAVALHNARGDGEADPHTLVLIGTVKPLECSEHLVGLLHIE